MPDNEESPILQALSLQQVMNVLQTKCRKLEEASTLLSIDKSTISENAYNRRKHNLMREFAKLKMTAAACLVKMNDDGDEESLRQTAKTVDLYSREYLNQWEKELVKKRVDLELQNEILSK